MTSRKPNEEPVLDMPTGQRVRWWSTHRGEYRYGTVSGVVSGEFRREVHCDDGTVPRLRWAEPVS